ncbi:hypothetical protein QJQ45_004756 [Haematococcus lacustris]|nr:hypothetical protein QJQ45_004756 [Haematococcus lacustris]
MTSDVALAHLASAVWPHGFASTVHAAVQGVVQGAQLSSRLQYLFFQAAAKFAGSLGVVQAWMPIVGPMDPTMQGFSDVTLFADTNLLILGDPKFQEFRNCSCQTPLQYKNSMPGRVWRTGAVQVVQNLRIVPPSLHPRSHLSEEHLDRLAEVLYIPVYDQLRPAQGPVAVLEAFMASHSAQAVIAADFLSFVGQALAPLQLSVANPLPQPIRRSALCGRRARGDQSAPDMSNQAPAGPVPCGAPGQGPDAGARPVSPAPTAPQGPALTDGRPQPSPLPHYAHLTQSAPQQQQQQATGGVAEASSQLHWAQVAAAQAAAGQGPRAPSPSYEADGGEGMEDEEDDDDDDDDEEEEELPAKVRRIMVRSKSMLAVTHWPGPRVEDAL